MGRHIAALSLLLTGCARVLAHIVASQCAGVTFTSSSSQGGILGMFFSDIWDSGAIARLHQLSPKYITYTAYAFIQISCLVDTVLSTLTTLFYQSSLLLVFLTLKSLPSSTVWSQFLITLIILITGSYSQCTYIVLHRKFSNWGHLLFHTPATLPTSPWKPCFLVLSFKAFSEFLLSYWSAPTALFITRPVFSAFSLPKKLSFFTLPSVQRMPCLIKSSYLFFFIFYNPRVTKYRNNVLDRVRSNK